MESEKLLILLKEKAALLEDIFSLTASIRFYGESGEEETYIDLIENRQKLFDKIFVLDYDIYKINQDEIDDKKDISIENERISDLSKKIYNLDIKNKEVIDKLMKELTSEMSQLNQQKQVAGYFGGANLSSGSTFDQRN